jgi:MFS transporter, DHA2 family, multidrug resistance protein
VDQRLLLGTGAAINVVALLWMSNLTLEMDFWSLVWPRLLQGFGMGFIFVPLQTLALSTVRLDRLSNATAAFNVVRNIGGSVGIAIVTTLLARRGQYHQARLMDGVDLSNPMMTERVAGWTAHFANRGADTFTAGRQALATIYQETVAQAQLMAFVDDFRLMAMLFVGVLMLIPFMRRIRAEETERRQPAEGAGRVEGLPAPSE